VKVEAVVGAARGAVGYLVYESPGSPALVVDAPLGTAPLYLKAIEQAHLSVPYIVITHGHWDQIADAARLAESTGADVCAHVWDAARLSNPALGGEEPPEKLPPIRGRQADRFIREAEELLVGNLTFTVMHTPGHTPGSLSLYEPHAGALFAGDILGRSGIGRSDLPGGNPRQLQESLARLAQLPDDTRIFPGHGLPTVLRDERWLLDLANVSTQ
jgi:glyoxylase-like metal-dependent hydrolase (beta-lactamase superfamily II)